HEAGPERLRRVFDEQFSFVWRYLRRLGLPPVDADDATQQVFLVLSRKLSRVPPEKERAFLCGTAVRVFSDARRAQSRRREIPGDTPVDAPDPKAGPEMLTGREQARALLDTVLDKMDEKTRSVFVLFELEELSTAEIAEILDLPTGTVASRLRRARESFEAIVARMRLRGELPGGSP
ncbi:MAG: sigma-70 family RNA polymerase sigma factor, partial [Polyangiaceae bacterium]